MSFVLPIDQLLEASATAAAGELNAATQAQIDLLWDSVKGADESKYDLLRQVAEGLFRGGKVPDLSLADPADKPIAVQASRHLKVGMALTLVALETEGLPGFADGLFALAKLVTDHWDTVLPPADLEDPEGQPNIRRLNCLSPLSAVNPADEHPKKGPVTASDSWRIVSRLLRATLLRSEDHGPLSVRDALSAWAGDWRLRLDPGEDRTVSFVQEVRLAATENLSRQREAIETALASLKQIDEVCSRNQSEVGAKPKLDYLSKLLGHALHIINDTTTSVEVEPTGTEAARTPIRNPSRSAIGPVSSREEAIKRLTEVADYFRRTEPSSPIPHFIERVKKLAGLNFLDILADLNLGEDVVPEFKKLVGIRDAPPPA